MHMSRKSRKTLSSPAQSIDRWENEGGATVQSRTRAAEHLDEEFSVAESRMLQRLGVAVLTQWNDMSVEAQRKLFRSASEHGISRNPDIRAQLARFLHDYKDDACNSMNT